MKKIIAFIASLWLSLSLLAQPATQTIRGTVIDFDSREPLTGATVQLFIDDGDTRGTLTEYDGTYIFEKVPLGRHSLEFSYVGYEKTIQDNILVTSAKEVNQDVELMWGASLDSVVVYERRPGEINNEMAIGGLQFSPEQTKLSVGSRDDPTRMVALLPGVLGADDSRNDIVIRGNTPQGLLWRLEGVSIPNPNHFAISGTTGGPVTILNNKFLRNSDFYTGAFPAEFGNGIAGAFDLRMRNGNDKRHEYSVQFGFLGTEIAAEGPLSREKKSTYLLLYRYSTLRLFEFLGIKVGTAAAPRYQDAAFRFNFPTKSGGSLAFWGIGGVSKIIVENSKIVTKPADLDNPDLYAEADRNQEFRSRMGVAGLTFTQPLSSGYFKATLAASDQIMAADSWKIFRQEVPNPDWDGVGIDTFLFDCPGCPDNKEYADSTPYFMYYFMEDSRFSAYLSLHKTFGRKITLKAGLNTDYWLFNYQDTFRLMLVPPDYPQTPPTVGDWRVRWDTRNQGALMIQPYAQMLFKFGPRFSATAGLTALYFGLNGNSLSPLEPRLGMAYRLGEKQDHKISLGYGLHSQVAPSYLYFYGVKTEGRDPVELNKDMGLFKSHHLVLGYDWFYGKTLRVRLETYYQYLFGIPVDKEPSSFSLVNTGSGFDRLFPKELVNEGTARNFGFEATVERSFSKGYYFLFSGSVFDSKYRGSDDVLRNTTFNGRFAFNGLVAKDFTFKKSGSALNLGVKVTYVGGRWRGEVDEEASVLNQKITYVDSTMNTIQVQPYFRSDLKVSFRWNRPKVYHEFGLDLVNITNYENLLFYTYVPDHFKEEIQPTYQLGFLPIFYYKLDFGIGK